MQTDTRSHIDPIADEDEIDLKEIFSTLLRYKFSILFIAAIATFIALVYAYFAPNIYQAQTMLKLKPENRWGARGDFMMMATGGQGSNIDDEIAVIQTRNMAKEALTELNIGTRYFVTRHFKTRELYKDSPFVVTSEFMAPNVVGARFKLIPIDDKRFRLSLTPPGGVRNFFRNIVSPPPPDKRPVTYEGTHNFNEPFDTPWFSLTVQKVYPLDGDSYSFSIVPNEEMAGFIQGGLSATSYVKYGNIIQLSFDDTVALRAKEVLDAISFAYLQEGLDIKSESAKKKLKFIDAQLDAINATLEGSAEKLQKYKATNIVMDLSSKAQMTSEKLSDLESKLYTLTMQISFMENTLNYLNTHQDLRGVNLGSTQEASQTITNIILQIQQATSKYAALSVEFTEQHPDVIKIRKQLASLRGSLKEAILNSLGTLKKQKNTLTGIIKENEAALQGLPEQQRQLERLSRNFMVNEKIYSYLLEKRAETAIIESSTVSEMRVIDPAVVPEGPIKPKRTLMVIVGMLLGFILGIALAFLRNFLDNTVKTVEDVEKLTSIPLYGAIPLLNTKKDIQHYNEAMRVIWTNLEFVRHSRKSKLITVTSSVSGEGKSTTIYQLAKTIAESSKKVILLDLDMRRATLHKKLELSNRIGMSSLLAHNCTLEEATQSSKNENLDVITSGPVPPNPTGLIMSDTLEAVINEILHRYDYVLIDSPPVGLVADAVKLMHMSDISLIMLKANFSKKEFIRNISRFTADDKINPGIILNGVQFTHSYGYGYGYGYSYGSKDSSGKIGAVAKKIKGGSKDKKRAEGTDQSEA